MHLNPSATLTRKKRTYELDAAVIYRESLMNRSVGSQSYVAGKRERLDIECGR